VRVTLLGPQRRPTVDKVVAALPGDGPVATVTAGWREREADDHELSKLLGGRDINLALYARWLDVTERIPEFAAAERRLQGLLEQAQELYLRRLDHAVQAAAEVQRRAHDPLADDVLAEAIAEVRASSAEKERTKADQ